MFEQIIGQAATAQVIADRGRGILAPSMLFSGPEASGKGTAALELGRILSCENADAPGDCSCAACAGHRVLAHPDMLSLGARNFSAEMSAGVAALLKQPENKDRQTFFVRSVRKLLSRFSPILWEEEPKFSKFSDAVLGLEEGLNELFSQKDSPEALKKRADGVLKNALKLEAEGVSDTIPIGQIRRAAGWCHLAPRGRRKLLLIENADRMQDGARNSLLKLLEEPPESVTILLTTSREKALLPTILSRVRPYRFIRRTEALEAEVIRRVFGDSRPGTAGIGGYLDGFLPVSEAALRPLAAFFAAFTAAGAVLSLRKRRGAVLPETLIAFDAYATGIAEAAGLGKPGADAQSVILKIITGAEKFEIRGLFSRFLHLLAGVVSESVRPLKGVNTAGFCDLWRKHIADAAVGVGIYNQTPAAALERLGTELRQSMTAYFSG